jgi:hypothetical protein
MQNYQWNTNVSLDTWPGRNCGKRGGNGNSKKQAEQYADNIQLINKVL